jgi:hypothetical protein
MAIEDYSSLITSEHSDQPKYMAMLTLLTGASQEQQALMQSYIALYDLDLAVGSQLDVVGQWVGLSRRLAVPIPGVYFTFDDPTVGFDAGVWKGPFDPDTGIISLDDDTYRFMLRIKIATNQWKGSLEDANAILGRVFQTSDTRIFIIDTFNMTQQMGISGVIPSTLFTALIVQGFLILRPAAVEMDGVTQTTVSGAPLFGFDSQNDYIGGFDSGAWGEHL